MPSAPSTSAARRSLARALVLAAAVGVVALPTGVAAADEVSTVTGELVQAWAEGDPALAAAGSEAEGPVAWIQPADGNAVPVDADDVAGIPSGSTVAVTVDGADDAEGATVLDATVLEAAPTAPVLSDPAGLTNDITVALVRPGGVPADTTTESQVVDAVTGPVADFWSEQTGGAVRLGVTESHDWTVTSADCSDPAVLWNEAAAKVGFVNGPGKHLLLYVSGAARGCSYALAEVGATIGSGGRLYVTEVQPSAIAHELGHNFGLGHSSALQCAGAVETGTCRTAGYRDYYDVMGASWAQLGSLNAPQAAQLGVLPAPALGALTVQDAATTVTLAPLAGSSGMRALRLTDAAGTVYWLEYRAATQRDGWLGTGDNVYRLQQGVLLRRAGTMPDTSVLLDGTPGAAADWARDFQAALPVGAPVVLSGGAFSVVVDDVSAAGAVLTVVPTPPAGGTTPVTPRPQPAGAPGAVMAGDAPAAAAPVTAALPALPALKYDGGQAHPSLESAADTTTSTGFVVAAATALLAGATLLLVRRFRAVRPRLR